MHFEWLMICMNLVWNTMPHENQKMNLYDFTCNFDNTQKEIKENEKEAQNLKSFHMEASYVQWLVGKMIKWEYHKLEKNIHKLT